MTPWLLPVVALAFAVEATLGFGATVVAVSLGALTMDVRELLPAFVPLNMALSTYLVVKDRRHVDGALLARRVLPAMVAGLPVGLLAFGALDAAVLRRILGVVVLGLALRELLRLGKSAGAVLRTVALVAAGAVHGALGSGGPLVIWSLGDRVHEPRALRATLAALWLSLNAVLLATYAWEGRVGAQSLVGSAWCTGGLLVGGVVGEVVHRRVDAARFGRAVWGALAMVGVLLLLR